MPNNSLHYKLWQMAFGSCGYLFIPVDSQMDEYSQKFPGIRHRLKDHDPLKTGDYEAPNPELDKWRIVYRFYHIAIDWWWTKLSKAERIIWKERIRAGYYPIKINEYFWKIVEVIASNPLAIYEILPWKCEQKNRGQVLKGENN